MLRLKSEQKQTKRDMLAIPGAEPMTLIRVSNEHLPYACQCPLCGGIFEIPQGVLYKIEDDAYADIDSGTEAIGGPSTVVENNFDNGVTEEPTRTEEPVTEE